MNSKITVKVGFVCMHHYKLFDFLLNFDKFMYALNNKKDFKIELFILTNYFLY